MPRAGQGRQGRQTDPGRPRLEFSVFKSCPMRRRHGLGRAWTVELPGRAQQMATLLPAIEGQHVTRNGCVIRGLLALSCAFWLPWYS